MTATSPIHEVTKEPALFDSVLELIRRTLTILPDDVVRAINASRQNETSSASPTCAGRIGGAARKSIDQARLRSGCIE